MPTVSVIMPVHNRETRLPGAVESILDQRYRDFELLVVDDGSTDRTPSVIDHYAALDRRVRHLRLPVNGGPGLARSMALKAASGDYVAIMDSDDVALAERLGRQVSFMEANPHVTLAGANAIKVMPQGRVQMKMAPGDAELKARLLLVDATFVHPTVMMRRQFLVQHRLTYSAERICDEDHDLYIRMVPGRGDTGQYARYAAGVSSPWAKYHGQCAPSGGGQDASTAYTAWLVLSRPDAARSGGPGRSVAAVSQAVGQTSLCRPLGGR